MRAQSAIEFISTYAWSLIIITIFLVIIAVFVFSKGTTTETPSSCYITPSMPCSSLLFTSNSSGSIVTLSFVNNLGSKIYFPVNSILVLSPSFTQTKYYGTCYPSNAPQGAQIVCNASLLGYHVADGAQLNFPFTLTYELCSPSCSSALYNTSGTATSFATPVRSLTIPVNLVTSTGTGSIAVQGVEYPNGTVLKLISGAKYTLGAGPATSLVFNSWSATNNVLIGNNALASTTFSANGISTITLVYRSALVLLIPQPYPSYNSIYRSATAYISDKGASGGAKPYSYQWLATTAGGSTYSATEANTLCGSSAQALTCQFQTNSGTVTGNYLFELSVTDSEVPSNTQISSPATVAVTYSTLAVYTPSPPTSYVTPGGTIDIADQGAYGGTAPYSYQWLSTAANGVSFSSTQANTLCGSSAQTTTCIFATNSLTPIGNYLLELQATDSESPSVSALSSTVNVVVSNALAVYSALPATNTVVKTNTAYITSNGAYGGVQPYVYQWLATTAGGSTYSATEANTLCGSSANTIACAFATSSSTPTGTYRFELQATDSELPAAVADSSSASVAVIPPNVILTFSDGNSITQGTSDTATGTTSATVDTVEILYCEGASCTPGNVFATGTATASNNLDGLASGSYVFEAYDVNAIAYSATNVVVISTAVQCTNTLYTYYNGVVPNTATISYTIIGAGGGGGGYGSGTSGAGNPGSNIIGSFTLNAGNTITIYSGGGGGGGSSGGCGAAGGGGGSGWYGGGGGSADNGYCGSGGGGGSSVILSDNILINYASGGSGGISGDNTGGGGGSSAGGAGGGYGTAGASGSLNAGGSGASGGGGTGGGGGSSSTGGSGSSTEWSGGGGGGYGSGGGGGGGTSEGSGNGGTVGVNNDNGYAGAGGGPAGLGNGSGLGGAGGTSSASGGAGGDSGEVVLQWTEVGGSCALSSI